MSNTIEAKGTSWFFRPWFLRKKETTLNDISSKLAVPGVPTPEEIARSRAAIEFQRDSSRAVLEFQRDLNDLAKPAK